MATNEELEVYKQRYETFRHLDKLRWQMLQIAVAVGSLVLAFGKGGSTGPDWWVWAVVGLLLFIFGFVMIRIGHGISMNGRVLKNAAELVGDGDIPLTAAWWKASSFWVAATIMVLGLLCLALAYLHLPPNV